MEIVTFERIGVGLSAGTSNMNHLERSAAAQETLQFALTGPRRISKLAVMVVHLKAETESLLRQLVETTGRAPDELVEDAMSGYLAELSQVRDMLDGRYDDFKSDRVQPIDGEAAFARLRQKSKDRRGA